MGFFLISLLAHPCLSHTGLSSQSLFPSLSDVFYSTDGISLIVYASAMMESDTSPMVDVLAKMEATGQDDGGESGSGDESSHISYGSYISNGGSSHITHGRWISSGGSSHITHGSSCITHGRCISMGAHTSPMVAHVSPMVGVSVWELTHHIPW